MRKYIKTTCECVMAGVWTRRANLRELEELPKKNKTTLAHASFGSYRYTFRVNLNLLFYGYYNFIGLWCARILTKIRPVVVWPDISSPAQSLASVMNVPSNSCLPCRLAFCSFCFGSFGASSGSLRQQMNANARHSSTTSRPAKNVNILDNRKHHHFLPLRQMRSGVTVE